MKKKLVAFILCISCVFSMSACSGLQLPNNKEVSSPSQNVEKEDINNDSDSTNDNNKDNSINNDNRIVLERPFRLAFWNIGHFSGGSYSYSTINKENYVAQLNEYRSFVYDTVNADIFAIGEYSKYFGKSDNSDEEASSVLFDNYHNSFLFEQNYYFCSSIFSNFPVANISHSYYESTSNIPPNQYGVSPNDHYYIESDLNINNNIVKLVVVHLSFNQDDATVNSKQMSELISNFTDYENVIMLGDWNVKDFSDFNFLVKNGYSLGNSNPNAYTYRLPAACRAIDNIVYKGVAIENFEIHETTLSDHYAISCDVSL